MRAALNCILLLSLVWACGPAPKHVLPTSSAQSSIAEAASRPVAPGPFDRTTAYRTAIGDYIKAMRTRDGSFPDTVFTGRHEELPDIELPSVIEQVSVRIVAPAEAESLKSADRFTYLNVFGWFTAEQVEFFVVNFKQGMRHAPDGLDDRHLYYSIRRGAEELTLDSLR